MTDERRHWYVAYVKSCMEQVSAGRLRALGIECYVPVQKVVRQWSDRKKVVDSLVIPRVIFVHSTEQERVMTLAKVNTLYKYITTKGPYTASIVPDAEMETFRNMVERGGRSVSFEQTPLSPGDRVRVVSGPLTGCECELVSVGGKRCLAVRLGPMGTAMMDLGLDDVRKIENN